MSELKPINHREILNLWPSIPDVANDVGFKYVAVWKWHKRNYIPPEWWCLLVESAHDRDIDLSYKLLSETIRNRKHK